MLSAVAAMSAVLSRLIPDLAVVPPLPALTVLGRLSGAHSGGVLVVIDVGGGLQKGGVGDGRDATGWGLCRCSDRTLRE